MTKENEKRIIDKHLNRIDKDLEKEVGHLTDDDAPHMLEAARDLNYHHEYDHTLHLECKHEKTAKRTKYYIDGNVTVRACIYCGHEVQ